jgi:hypothetical protein
MWGFPLSQGSALRTLSAGERSITSGFNRKVPGRGEVMINALLRYLQAMIRGVPQGSY